MYKLSIVRRYPKGLLDVTTQHFESLIEATRSQNAIITVAERDKTAVAVTLIEGARRREPKISSAYQAILQGQVA